MRDYIDELRGLWLQKQQCIDPSLPWHATCSSSLIVWFVAVYSPSGGVESTAKAVEVRLAMQHALAVYTFTVVMHARSRYDAVDDE